MPARAASPAIACFGPRRGIERPRGTFVGGGAAATLCALSSRAALSFVFGLGSRAGAASLRASWGVPRRRRRLRGRDGLRAEPENQGQNRWCFFRGNGRLGRRREPWRGREAPGEGCGGETSMQPVYLAKANAPRTKQIKALHTARRRWLHVCSLALCCAESFCASPAREAPCGSRETSKLTGDRVRRFVQSTPPPRPPSPRLPTTPRGRRPRSKSATRRRFPLRCRSRRTPTSP